MANDFISLITLPDNLTYDIKDNMAVRGNARIFYGTCSDAVAAKTVTCAAYDSLLDGDILFVNFSQVNTGAVGSITLDVNGTGARNVKYLNNASDPANIPGTGYIRAATYMFRYKLGTSSTNSYWIIDIQYNSTGSDTVTRLQIDTSRTGKYSLLQASMVIGTATNTTAYSTYRSDNIYAEPSTGIIYATEFSGNVAWNNITDKPTIPSSFTITANATDGLWDLTGTSGTNAVTYALAPYNSKGNTATFYTAATNPTLTTRLNYDGYFYATKLYSGGAEVLTSYTETDPTVPSWAKASTKPSYTANEVGALPSSTVVNKVKQSSNSSSAAYKVLFGTTASPTSGNDYETYYGSLTYNPNTKALVTGGTVDGYTLAAAAAKGVVTSVDTSANLPTANAVKTFVENKGYVTSSGVTLVSTGAGLTGGDITTTGTVKANLTSETKLTNAAADGTETSERVYPVRLDKNGKLAVNVPWTNVNNSYLTTITFDGTYNASSNKAATVSTVTDAINNLDVNSISGFGTTKTLKTLTETDGKIAATFQEIAFPVSSVAGLSGAIEASNLTTALGLSSAMHYRGTSAAIPPASGTYVSGDVLVKTDTDEEYVYDGTSWRLLGSEGSYKLKQDAVSDPTASATTSTTFIDTISQNILGVITATKKTLPTASTSTAGIIQIGTDATNAMAGNTTVNNVTLTVTSSGYTYWRPLLAGNSSGTAEGFTVSTTTGATYGLHTVKVQPSTGTIKATTFKGALIGDVTGNVSGSAGSVAWANVSGKPTQLSDFTDDVGYLTAHGNSYGKVTVSAQSSAVTALTAQSSATTPSSKSANETLKFTTANKWIIATGTESSTAGADEIKIAHLVPSSISNSGPTSAQTPGYNSTFNIPVISLDEAGHVTGISTTTVKIPASDNTDHYPSAWCDTAAGTQAKTAYCTDYTLTENTWLHVLIKNANSYNGKITLNVNSKGAKDIWINGTVSSSTNKTLPAGTYLVYYDGTKYEFRTDGLLPGSISGNADSVTLIPTTDSFWNWRKVLVGVSNSDTDAAVAANTNGSVYQTNSVSILPASGKLKATELIGNTITINNSGDTTDAANLVFSREGWNHITMPNNDNSVLAIGYGTGTNYSRLVIHKTGTVRPGKDNEQFLGSSNYRWKRVYGVDFYGNLTGTASGNLPLSGGTLTGTLTLKPASGEGGQINLAASTANTTLSGIVIDLCANELRIFGIASADGTTRTGTGTQLHIDPYLHTLYGAYDVTFKTIKIDNSADNSGVPHLIFSRTGWNYITIPNNDSSVLSIGFGETGNNANQRLVIFKTGTVRPGANGSQDLGDSTHKWNNVYGLNFYGNTFSGTANTANLLGKLTITNSSLDEFVSDGSFKYSWAGGSNLIVSKPTNTDAFGVMTFKTADNWTGQIFVSTNLKPGIYWRLNLTTSSPSYGNWTRLANGNANIYYGTSDEAANVAVKPVACADYHTLTVGDILIVTFTNINSATEPSLNVNNTGAKAIRASYSGGLTLLSSSSQIRDTCMFIYDGTYWVQMSTDCVKQVVTDSSSAVWRAVLVSASNNSNESFTPDQLFAKTYAAHNVKYQASTGTFRAPIFKSTMFKLEYDHVDKAYATWNNTDNSIDFIFM